MKKKTYYNCSFIHNVDNISHLAGSLAKHSLSADENTVLLLVSLLVLQKEEEEC